MRAYRAWEGAIAEFWPPNTGGRTHYQDDEFWQRADHVDQLRATARAALAEQGEG